MDYLKQEVAEYVEFVWDKTLGLPIFVDETEGEPTPSKEPTHTGIVQIGGDWAGAISIELERGLALQAASSMFQMALEQVGEEDTIDVLSEIANIVAGNIKSVLPGESALMIPIVAIATAPSISMAESDLVTCVRFRCQDQLMTVRIHQKRG